jgi:hypothetical protein
VRAGIDAMMQRDLGEQGQGVGLPLRHRGRFRGNVLHTVVCSFGDARSLVQRLAGGLQRAEEEGACLGR